MKKPLFLLQFIVIALFYSSLSYADYGYRNDRDDYYQPQMNNYYPQPQQVYNYYPQPQGNYYQVQPQYNGYYQQSYNNGYGMPYSNGYGNYYGYRGGNGYGYPNFRNCRRNWDYDDD